MSDSAELQVTQLPIAAGLQVTVPADWQMLTTVVLAEQGDWFEHELRFVRAWLRPGMAVVDVGANFGQYTLPCAHLVGPTGRVWSFEPAGLPLACLRQSLESNALTAVTLSEKALSDHAGQARLAIESNPEFCRLTEDGPAGEMVPVSTLDLELAAADHPIDFLKLDAEGGELRILAGGAAFFAAHDPLVMFALQHAEGQTDALIDAFHGLRMDIYRLLPGPNLLVPYDPAASQDPFLLNLFACRSTRAGLLAAEGRLARERAEPPSSSPEEDLATVQDRLAASPWAHTFWPGGLPAGPAKDLRAVADVVRSEETARPAGERWALLERAMSSLVGTDHVPGLFTAARAAMALGAQRESCGLLLQAGGALLAAARSGRLTNLDRLFLPPDPAHDLLDPLGQPATSLWVMLDEALVARGAYSIYFDLENIGPILVRLARNPLRSAATQRRLEAADQWQQATGQ